jgi:hypothetical protein
MFHATDLDLAALLRVIGVDVPEWPSKERLRDLGLDYQDAPDTFHHIVEALPHLRDLFRREPLTVLALLSEDA